MATKNNPPAPMPWERQPGETTREYMRFSFFRDLPYKDRENVTLAQMQAARKLSTVAKDLKLQYSGVRETSAKHKWTERAAAYDDHMDELNRIAQEADIIKMRRLHAQVAVAMIKKAAEKILATDIEEVSVRDAIRMFEVGVRCERLSRGESTENLSTEMTDATGLKGMQSLIKSLQEAHRARQGE